MATEWLRIMLDEIARKEQEAREAREEEIRRHAEESSEPPDDASEHDRVSSGR